MKILFLDQSGDLGGAEISLLDIAKFYRDSCLVSLFVDGSFKKLLEENKIPVRILSDRAIAVSRNSSLCRGLASLGKLIPIIDRVTRLSYAYDLIYANTQKALIVGAIANAICRKPLVYHLRDILSSAHFSQTNCHLAVFFANRFASLVIANSKATSMAFLKAGGRTDLVKVVYNGFQSRQYQNLGVKVRKVRQQLQFDKCFLVGHFSRFAFWKGQNILIEALSYCPDNVVAIFVGDAFFGAEDYLQQLQEQVIKLKLEKRVHFLGFRSDIPELMTACDLIAHTSIAPEPFGRVIVEAMLSGKPVIASGAGGAVELIEHGKTGWLTPPGDALKLAETIKLCRTQPEETDAIAQAAKREASQRFNLSVTNQKIAQLLDRVYQLHKN